MQSLKAREEIPALARVTYLDSAGAGLPPVSVTDAMKRLVDDWSTKGERWEEWLLDVVECRRLFGKLIGGRREEVAVVPSVSVGLAAIASSFDFSRRKKIVTSSLNFPTNIILWQRMRERGIVGKVEVLPHEKGSVPLEAYERTIDDDTAIVAVDYVSWLSGAREQIREISELAHMHGALLVVDAFHALGVFPFDAKRDGIDLLVSGFYKWLCGPHGVACVYSSEDALSRLNPPYLGWHGIEDSVIERILRGRDPFDVPFSQTHARPSRSAARFEWGTWATVAVKGAIEALKFAFKNDPGRRFKAIRERKIELTEGLDGLAEMQTPPLDENLGGGIVTFRRRNHAEFVSRLMKEKVIVSGRFGFIRVSPHFYNTEGDTQRFLRVARRILRR